MRDWPQCLAYRLRSCAGAPSCREYFSLLPLAWRRLVSLLCRREFFVDLSLYTSPSSQHWNVQFLEMIMAQILNLSYSAISQDNTFVSDETTRVSDQKDVFVASDVDAVRELFCCSAE